MHGEGSRIFHTSVWKTVTRIMKKGSEDGDSA
jgi:hypothetical protein